MLIIVKGNGSDYVYVFTVIDLVGFSPQEKNLFTVNEVMDMVIDFVLLEDEIRDYSNLVG